MALSLARSPETDDEGKDAVDLLVEAYTMEPSVMGVAS